MKVIKRDGKSVDVSYDEIKRRIQRLCSEDELRQLDIDLIVIKTIHGIRDGITTSDLDDLSAREAASLQSVHYLYDSLAAKIMVSDRCKSVSYRVRAAGFEATFSGRTQYIASILGVESFYPAYIAFVTRHAKDLDDMLCTERDSQHTYFALRTLERSYLLRDTNDVCIESPQDMWLRVAVSVNLPRDGSAGGKGESDVVVATEPSFSAAGRLARVRECYDTMSRGLFTHATPTLFNAGMRHQQMSSCFVAGTQVATLNAGIRRIEDVQLGDLVVTHTGAVKPVTQLHRNPLAGRQLYKMCVFSSKPVRVTGNHRFWAVRHEAAHTATSPEWIRVDELAAGDFVGVPRIRLREEPSSASTLRSFSNLYDWWSMRNGGGSALSHAPATWPVDEDMAFFLGACLASECSVPEGDTIRIIIPPGHDGCEQTLRRVAEKEMGGIVFRAVDTESEAVIVQICSRTLVQVLADVFGDADGQWQLPPQAFSMAAGIAAALMRGAAMVGWSTPHLYNQLYHLARCHGVTSVLNGTDLPTESVLTVGAHTLLEIQTVEPVEPVEPVDDVVYTLGVEDDHSYGVEGLLAENCYLLGTEDSLSGIFKTISDCAQISKWAGGLGVHVSNVRAKGSRIRSTNGVSDGIIPMLKVYNEMARYCNQAGRRKGSVALYLEPWHADVFEFVELRRNTGAESERARDLFLALWIPDEFMRRVQADDDWYLMSSDQSPGLQDAVGDAFSKLYAEHIAAGNFMRKIKARALWQHVLQCLLETGVPYIMFKDKVNAKSNHANVGVIRSSNLCVAPETLLLTSTGYHAIADLRDKEVRVWNGDRFAPVTVRQTGQAQPLVSVVLSNGETIECTPYHQFLLQPHQAGGGGAGEQETQGQGQGQGQGPSACEVSSSPTPPDAGSTGVPRRVPAHDLTPGDILFQYSLPVVGGGVSAAAAEDACSSTFGSGGSTNVHAMSVPINASSTQRKLHWLEALADDALPIPHRVRFSLCPLRSCLELQLQLKLKMPLKGPAEEEGRAHVSFLRDIRRMLTTLGVHACLEEGAARVVVDGSGAARLRDLGFSPRGALGDGIKGLCSAVHQAPPPPVTVVRVEDRSRVDDTFCFTEPISGRGTFNGVVTGQCAEICEYSDADTYAVCNLASIAVNRFLGADGAIDHARLHAVTKMVARNLDRIIDLNHYPTPETRASNAAMRPIGIGIQGMADLYCEMRLKYGSPEALRVDAEIMETIYHGALEASAERARKHGPYPQFQGSPFSKGVLQFDMWGPDAGDPKGKAPALSGRWDWEELRARIVKGGTRNSLLTALMPTASTSQILGNNEMFEPMHSNVFKRSTLAGEFLVVNKCLMRDLLAQGLWSTETRQHMLLHDGSVQSLPGLSAELKEVYRTVWEVPQRAIIDHAVARGPFVDQSQSMNLFHAVPSILKLNSALFHAWESGLKTGCYYLRSRPATEASKVTLQQAAPAHASGGIAPMANATTAPSSAPLACLRDDPTCEMCSA